MDFWDEDSDDELEAPYLLMTSHDTYDNVASMGHFLHKIDKWCTKAGVSPSSESNKEKTESK